MAGMVAGVAAARSPVARGASHDGSLVAATSRAAPVAAPSPSVHPVGGAASRGQVARVGSHDGSPAAATSWAAPVAAPGPSSHPMGEAGPPKRLSNWVGATSFSSLAGSSNVAWRSCSVRRTLGSEAGDPELRGVPALSEDGKSMFRIPDTAP